MIAEERHRLVDRLKKAAGFRLEREPVRRCTATRFATCRATAPAIARGASGRCAATALKVPGTVETEPIIPSGSSRARMSAAWSL
jgi:hypothetical protein